MPGGPNVLRMAGGPATELIEATATSIGAGMLIGGFIAGLFALASGVEPARRDHAVLVGSSVVGLLAVGAAIVETAIR